VHAIFNIPPLDKRRISSIQSRIKLATDKAELFEKYSDDFRLLEGDQILLEKIQHFLGNDQPTAA
jgi:hypothetical protein